MARSGSAPRRCASGWHRRRARPPTHLATTSPARVSRAALGEPASSAVAYSCSAIGQADTAAPAAAAPSTRKREVPPMRPDERITIARARDGVPIVEVTLLYRDGLVHVLPRKLGGPYEWTEER